MVSNDFELLKDYIIDRNKYFNRGFANAFTNEKNGRVLVKNGRDYMELLPSDRLSNYFYLRNDPTIKHALGARLEDFGGIYSYNDTLNICLVAVVNDADAYQLINNLRNTVLFYKPLSITATQSAFNRIQVLSSELKGVEEEDLIGALQRLKNETIVSVTLQVTKEFNPNRCIENPCKTC
jgi:hypothetical protein